MSEFHVTLPQLILEAHFTKYTENKYFFISHWTKELSSDLPGARVNKKSTTPVHLQLLKYSILLLLPHGASLLLTSLLQLALGICLVFSVADLISSSNV